MAKHKTVAAVLRAAYGLIRSRRRWCQRAIALDRNGLTTSANSNITAPVQWCAIGALDWARLRAGWPQSRWRGLLRPLTVAARNLYGTDSIAELNDRPKPAAGHRRVLRVYRLAIKLAQGRPVVHR